MASEWWESVKGAVVVALFLVTTLLWLDVRVRDKEQAAAVDKLIKSRDDGIDAQREAVHRLERQHKQILERLANKGNDGGILHYLVSD